MVFYRTRRSPSTKTQISQGFSACKLTGVRSSGRYCEEAAVFGLGAPELLIIFIVLVIPVGIVFLILASRSSRRSSADPIGVLGERLARGEISPAEYDKLRRHLE